MCRKLIYLVSFILVLSLVSNALADLVGHWEFEGDFKDSSAGHDGDPRGNATIVYDVNRNSNVLSLPGGLLDGDAVATPAIGDLDEFTIMMWINAETLGSGADKISFFSTPEAASAGLQIQSRAQNLQVLVGTGEGTNKIDGSALGLNEWFHLAVTFKSDELAGYINGELDVSKVLSAAPLAAVGEAYIGNWTNPGGEFRRGLTGKMDDVRIYDTALTAEAIHDAMEEPVVKNPHAWYPAPADESTYEGMYVVLSWNPGIHATSHEVYFGTDADALTRVATKALGDETYDPGPLAWDTTYYWRVDEANNLHPDSPWVGSLWSFTTADYLVVDNFEDYLGDEVSVVEQIWGQWGDGLGYGEPPPSSPPYSPGNGTGSEIGDGTTDSYTEETITHGASRQAMPYWFNNNKPDKSKYSEAKRTVPAGLCDWTAEGIKALSLWFCGDPANAAERMYVAIANNTGPPAVVLHDNANATQIDTWTEWNIDLKEFQDQGIDLSDVNSIAIGFGDRNNPQVGGAGKMYFDDIRLYRPRCIPEELTLSAADLNSDCIVDFADLELMAGEWLAGDLALAADLNADGTVDFKDYAALAEAWLEEQLWPQW